MGIARGIPNRVLTAIEHQAGSGQDMAMEDMSNLPDLFFMRLLDQTRIDEEGEVTTHHMDETPPHGWAQRKMRDPPMTHEEGRNISGAVRSPRIRPSRPQFTS